MKTNLKRTTLILALVVIVTLLVAAFAGCSGQKDEGKLYVGLECAYSPFNYTQKDDSNGAVPIYNTNYKQTRNYANGYDIMIAKRIADALGKELVVVKMEWDALVPAVKAGTVDLIIAGMSPTEKRLEEIDFSDPYYQSNLVLVVRKDSQYAEATSLADFSGAKVAAQQGTFHDDALKDQGTEYGILRQTPLADFPALINALKTNAIDAYVAEEPGAIENCASNSEFTYIRLQNNTTGFIATDADTAIAVGLIKGSELTAQINAILAQIAQAERDEMMQLAIQLSTGDNIVE